jgi:NAD(P)-dependent dehydrogenase (short-subunit alcohol dehydrogenase family)
MYAHYVVRFLTLLALVVFGSYWLPKLLVSLLPVPDLKKKYGAEWAVVTGSSSGIGKSLAIKLAQQGVNVVLVALQEDILDETFAELQAQFKTRKFIKIGVNLGTPGYLDKIDEATKAVDVQLVFNNAGFMLTGFFDKQCVQSHNIYRTFYRTSPTTDMSLYISISPQLSDRLRSSWSTTSATQPLQCRSLIFS